MKTAKFLTKNLTDEALITICNNKGSIKYEGVLSEIPYSVIKGTVVTGLELGYCGDIIIEITEE